jgi:glycosyltransferase involved in cell wall biosynthesis
MQGMFSGNIAVLSNVFDDQYCRARGEEIDPCLSNPKRRDLFRCLEIATQRSVTVLSSPPKAAARRRGKWLPAMDTRFSTHEQKHCANWDVPKLRIPLAWWFYAWHVSRHVRTGDLVMLDNYELLYVIAACLTRVRRKVTFILDYEDGKHLTDQGWSRVLSSAAETVGKRFIRGALLAHPALGERLPKAMPKEFVPGFVVAPEKPRSLIPATEVRFLYSGSFDSARGVDLLLEAIPLLPESGWVLEITGRGPLVEEVARVADAYRKSGMVRFHGALPQSDYAELLGHCHVGLNCQRASNPISGVTFPSKVFSYLSAGLVVLSSTASNVASICGTGCLYFEEENAESLAAAMKRIISAPEAMGKLVDTSEVMERYSIQGTAKRLSHFLRAVQSATTGA